MLLVVVEHARVRLCKEGALRPHESAIALFFCSLLPKLLYMAKFVLLLLLLLQSGETGDWGLGSGD
jgi:hypothetical protein